MHPNIFVKKYSHGWLKFGWKTTEWVTPLIASLYLGMFIFFQVMINNVRFTFSSVSDTMRVVYNRYRARQIDLMTPNAIFSVLIWDLLYHFLSKIGFHVFVLGCDLHLQATNNVYVWQSLCKFLAFDMQKLAQK